MQTFTFLQTQSLRSHPSNYNHQHHKYYVTTHHPTSHQTKENESPSELSQIISEGLNQARKQVKLGKATSFNPEDKDRYLHPMNTYKKLHPSKSKITRPSMFHSSKSIHYLHKSPSKNSFGFSRVGNWNDQNKKKSEIYLQTPKNLTKISDIQSEYLIDRSKNSSRMKSHRKRGLFNRY